MPAPAAYAGALYRTGAMNLSRAKVDAALPCVAEGLSKYEWLQTELPLRKASTDREFQRRFNAFYRVRRRPTWQAPFYDLLERGKVGAPSFADVLNALWASSGRVEASFASKLLASLDPSQPIIDSIVLKNLGLRLSATGTPQGRIDHAMSIHRSLQASYAAFLFLYRMVGTSFADSASTTL